MRGLLLLLASFLSIAVGGVAEARPGNAFPALRIGHRTGVVSPGAPDEIVTLRSPSNNQLDLAAATASCSDTELITVTATGAVPVEVWPLQNANLGTWYKNELIPNQGLTMAFAPAGIADGVNVGRLTVSCSASTHIIQFNASTPEVNTWNYGLKTEFGRHAGGFPFYYLPGNPSDWTVDPAYTDHWEKWNNRLVVKCSGSTTACTLDGSATSYGTGGTAACALATTCALTPVVNNAVLGISRTITIVPVANQRDVAPDPTWSGWVKSGANSQMGYALANTGKACGDTILFEGSAQFPQSYGSNTGAFSFTSNPNPTCASPPSGPYGSMITVRSRELFAAKQLGFTYGNGQSNTAVNRAPYFRIFGWDCWDTTNSLVAGCFTIASTTTSGMVQWDHNKAPFLHHSGATNGSYDVYVVDNFTRGISVNAYDCRIDGNWVRSVQYFGDGIDFGCPNSGARGSDFASVSDNFVVDMISSVNGGHSDYTQSQPHLINSLDGFIGKVDGPLELRNIYYHGAPHVTDCYDVYRSGVRGDYNVGSGTCQGALNGSSSSNDGTPANKINNFPAVINPAAIGTTEFMDGQCALRANYDLLGPQVHTVRIVGMICTSAFKASPAIWAAGSGSFIRNSTIVNSANINAVPKVPEALTSDILVRGTGATVQIKDVLSTDSALNIDLVGVTAVAPVTTGSSFNLPMSTWPGLNNYTYVRIQDVLDKFAQSTHSGKGAVGSSLINHRRRYTDPSLLADPGFAAAPLCTGGTTAVTGTASVGGTLTASGMAFSGSPTSYQNVWLRNFAPISGATGTSYVLQPEDGGKTIHFTQVALGAGGKGTCASGPTAISP